MKLTPEQMQVALTCANAEELVARAAEVGKTISLEQAQAFLDENAMVELSEDDIDNVSGGCGTIDGKFECPKCHGRNTEDLGTFTGKQMIKCYDCNMKYGWNITV